MEPAKLFFNSLVAVLLCLQGLMGQDKYFLDLTVPQPMHKRPTSGFGCGPRLSGGDHGGIAQPVAPLKLLIVRLDKSVYTWGEDVTFEVRLINEGRAPFPIPWSRNSDYDNKDCTGGVKDLRKASLTGVFALIFSSHSGAKHRVPIDVLYARLSMPETFRVLAPGESARIKLRGPLTFKGPLSGKPSDANSALSQHFAGTARYSLDDTSHGNPYADLDSANSLEVTMAESPGTRK